MVCLSFLSPQFFGFFLVTALVFLLLPRRMQNPWLLLASWFFYLCARPVYLLFLLFAILSTYLTALLLELAGRGLGALGFQFSATALDLILPLGISFYTFQAMGYVVDVYRGKVAAERNFLLHALFLSFFPQLASGPIGRAGDLLPQFKAEHRFDYDDFRSGLLRFL